MGDSRLTSTAFEDGVPIPKEYGKAFENVDPPLSVDDIPTEARSLALVVADPDAPGGIFDHWLVWNIPPDTTKIPEGPDPESGVSEGRNDFGNVGDDGPKPSRTHTYRFIGYALDRELGLSEGATKSSLVDARDGLVLAQTVLRGTFAPQ